MSKYVGDYCISHVEYGSSSKCKNHNQGEQYKNNIKLYFQKYMEGKTQNSMIDISTDASKTSNIGANEVSIKYYKL